MQETWICTDVLPIFCTLRQIIAQNSYSMFLLIEWTGRKHGAA